VYHIFDAWGQKLHEQCSSHDSNLEDMMSPDEMRELLHDIRQPVSREIDINLRIHLLEKQLMHRTDLTRKERRALQARKNTSIFRVRQ
jgi:hypothetical protein